MARANSAPEVAEWRTLAPETATVVAVGADLARLLDHVARRAGSLTFSQYLLLGALRERHPEAREPRELGEALGAGSAQVTALLDQLERTGLVVREAHARDRRRRLVRLTAAGLERVDGVRSRMAQVEAILLQRAAADGSLLEAAERLRSAVREMVAGDLSFLLRAEPGHLPAEDV